MKRVRHEQIQSSVNSYLKRRGYPSSESHKAKMSDAPRRRSLRETTVMRAVSLMPATDVMSYSAVSADATAYDQQFTRLKQYVHEAPDLHQPELRHLLFPIFAHIYLDLLTNGHKAPGHKFYGRHVSFFKDQSKHSNFLSILDRITSRNDVQCVRDVLQFRRKKYQICLKDDTLRCLMKYLKTDNNVNILQVLNQHIDIKVMTPESPDLDLHSPLTAQGIAPLSPPLTPENKVIQDENALNSLQQSIQRVREGPCSLPSVCVYTIKNEFGGTCGAEFSSDNTQLCTANDDSSIQIWSLTHDGLTVSQTPPISSRFSLAADYSMLHEQNLDEPSQSQSHITLRGHSGPVYRATFLDNDRHILSCSQDSTVRLWNVFSRNNLVCYRGHNYPVWGLDVSHNSNNQFVSCSHDTTAKLWHTDHVYPVRSFIGHTSDVDCIQFHPNGTYLATGSLDKTVRLWSVTDAKCLRLFSGHKNCILSLAFSPDGKYLASAGEDRRVKIWDLGSGRIYKDLQSHTDTVYSLSFNRNSTLLASGGIGGTIHIWDITKQTVIDSLSTKTTSPSELATYPMKKHCIVSLKYTHHNTLYATATNT